MKKSKGLGNLSFALALIGAGTMAAGLAWAVLGMDALWWERALAASAIIACGVIGVGAALASTLRFDLGIGWGEALRKLLSGARAPEGKEQ